MHELMQKDIKNKKYILVAENIENPKLTDLISENIGQKYATIYAKRWMM